MLRKSKRPLLASFEKERQQLEKKPCVNPAASSTDEGLIATTSVSNDDEPVGGTTFKECPPSQAAPTASHQDTSSSWSCLQHRHDASRWTDPRLITDPADLEALEAIVFGEGYAGEAHYTEKALYSEGNEREGDVLERENVAAKIEEELKEEEEDVKLNCDDADEKSLNLLEGRSGDDTTDDDDYDGEEDVALGCCAWRDSDDEDGGVDLESHPKLKKLKKEGNLIKNSTIVSAKDYQEKLRKFHLRKRANAGERWLDAMKAKQLGSDEMSSSDDEEKEVTTDKKRTEEKKKRAPVSKFVSSSIPILQDTTTQRIGGGDLSRISYRMLWDANRTEPSNCPLAYCGFIPRTTNLLYTAGRDKTIRIFKVDGKDNPTISSIHLKNTPIRSAIPVPSRDHLNPSIYFLTSYKTLCHLDIETNKISFWDIFGSTAIRKFQHLAACPSIGSQPKSSTRGDFVITTDTGDLLLCDVRSRSLVRSYKTTAGRTSLAFDPKGENRFFSGDAEGMISVWDFRSTRCIERFRDEGSLRVTALASGTSSQRPEAPAYLAAGSASGYVTIYDVSHPHGPIPVSVHGKQSTTSFMDEEVIDHDESTICEDLHFGQEFVGSALPEEREHPLTVVQSLSEYKSPLKALGHLTTPITSLAFHPSANLLAMSTKWTAEGIKLASLPSFTVYSNFPNQNGSLKLKYPTSLSFNDGDLMAIGNDHGQVKLVQLNQYITPLQKKIRNSQRVALPE